MKNWFVLSQLVTHKLLLHYLTTKSFQIKVSGAVPESYVATGIKRTASAAGLSKTPSPKKQAFERAATLKIEE